MSEQEPKRRKSGLLNVLVIVLVTVVVIAIAAAVLFPVFAKARAKAYSPPAAGPPRLGGLSVPEEAPPYASEGEEVRATGGLFGTPAEAATERKIVYTADYRIKVDDAEASSVRVEALAKQAGGFLSDRTKTVDDADNRAVTVTVRVPAEKFHETLGAIEKLGKVVWGEVASEEVTRQYIDLEARLRIAKQEEGRLAELMNRSAKLEDIIKVEEKLSEVQERIERLQGELGYLQERVALSTIRVQLYEELLAQVAAPGPFHIFYYVRGAYNALNGLLRAIVVVIIYGIMVGWILWLPLLARYLLRRRRRPPESN